MTLTSTPESILIADLQARGSELLMLGGRLMARVMRNEATDTERALIRLTLNQLRYSLDLCDMQLAEPRTELRQ